jgi:hypothetical protein
VTHKPKPVRFHVEFGEEGMPDLTDAPDDTAVPIKFRMEREVEVLEGAPDPNEWDDKQQGMFLYLLILYEYQEKLPPGTILTKAMVDDAMEKVRNADDTIDGGPLELMIQRAKRLAASNQYERAGALWRKYETEVADAREREHLAELGKKVANHLEESRAEAAKANKEAAQKRYKVWKPIALAIRKEHPDWSNTQVAQAVAKRLGTPDSWHAVRKQLAEFGAQRKKQRT